MLLDDSVVRTPGVESMVVSQPRHGVNLPSYARAADFWAFLRTSGQCAGLASKNVDSYVTTTARARTWRAWRSACFICDNIWVLYQVQGLWAIRTKTRVLGIALLGVL
jgi:hypothetical protein